MISVRWVLQWATSSQEQALRNAREAAVRCGQARLERAEVEDYLARLTPRAATPRADHAREAGSAGR